MMGSMRVYGLDFSGLMEKSKILANYYGDRFISMGGVSLFVCLLFIANECVAQSQLVVAPTRIVFSDKMRSSQVTIVNAGDETGTFRISFVNKRMTVDGNFEDVKEAKLGEQFADKMIRYSPRQVVLEPGKSQVVRLGLRKPANLAQGEYRSHMLFKAIPKAAARDIQSSKPSEGIKIQLTAILAISIPVIVRHGHTEADVSFVSAVYKKRLPKEDYPHLELNLQRIGDQSVYGDFLAEFIGSKGVKTVVGQAKGVAIYTPGKERRVRLPLTLPPGLELVNGVIHIFYRSPADQGGKVMAQIQVKMP
jgi:P pilus assembly chaperone PapD